MNPSDLGRLVRRGRGRAFDRHEEDLAAAIREVLSEAGTRAARAFRSRAGASLVAAAPTPRSAMIAVYPAPDEAALLARTDGEPAEELHVTLAFLGEIDEDQEERALEVVREVAASFGAVSGEVGGVATFGSEADAEEPLYPSILLPDVPGLAELRQAVCDALEGAGIEYATNHGWTPHLTLDYTSEPSPPPASLIGEPLTFDRLTFAVGDQPRDVELGGSLAASAALVTTYELTQGSTAHRIFEETAMKAGYREASGAEWPSEDELQDVGEVLYRDGGQGVYRLDDGTLVCATLRGGWFRIHVSAPSRVAATDTITAFSQAYPPLYRQETEGNLVPITFWALGNFGPTRRLRMVEAASWGDVAKNYTAPVRETLDAMMESFEPGKSGQLILWQGPPGTGKTWALRALASEWRSWAEFHYITDPDAFFVTAPDYMIDVLLSDTYEEYVEIDGNTEVVSTDRAEKWRVLILEDTGELLAANAKESYGQGLSRLLNVVDGLVGQGLRVLVLVTTNDELGDLHPAVKRPGRCAVQLTFGPLTDEEAAEWSGDPEIGAGTIAELYERMQAGTVALEPLEPLEEDEPTAVLAAGGIPDWQQPHPDELVDVDDLIRRYRTRTDPVRRAVVEEVVSPAVEGVGIDFDVTNPFVDAVLGRTGENVTHIAQTTRLNVLRIIRASYEQGLSIPDTAKAIQEGMAAAATARARMIARTELVGLANGGTIAAGRIVSDATGVPYEKRWLTAPGAKHPRHERYLGLDGQTVPLDGRFDVGGHSLAYPGDPDGPAEEVINCRCTTILVEAKPPKPDEIEVPELAPAETTPEERALEQAPPPTATADFLSVGAGPPVPPPIREKIERMGFHLWPPRKTALAREVFGEARDTAGLHKRGGEWTAERRQLHERIVASHFEGKVAAEGPRQAYFTSGGGASGKSSAVFNVRGREVGLKELAQADDVVLIDPDRIKLMLPEYKTLREKNDFYAATGVHEESSEIAKAVTAEAQRRGLSIIVDTTGSSSRFVGKLEAAHAAGYEVQVTSFSIPTNEAIVRAMARGDRSGRYVAIEALKKAHSGAARQAAIWKDSPIVREWRVYDNSGATARLVAQKAGGQVRVYDDVAFRRILQKADEQPSAYPGQVEQVAAMRPSELAKNLTSDLDPSKKDISAALATLDEHFDITAARSVDVKVVGNLRVGDINADAAFDPKTFEIQVRRLQNDRYSAFLHEFGHYLDVTIGGGRYATLPGRDAFRAVAPVVTAIQRSAAHKVRRDALEATLESAPNANSVIRLDGVPFHRAQLEYASDVREEWARAFVQWFAKKDPRLAEHVREHREHPRYAAQRWFWDDVDFGPISDALDLLFERNGWLRTSAPGGEG